MNAELLKTVLLLTGANLFMTIAWYGHLKSLGHWKWASVVLITWFIALFEYMMRVPANRIGYTVMNLAQLKILQEVIMLSVFVPFAILYMKAPIKLDYLWAALCLVGAVYFIFRN